MEKEYLDERRSLDLLQFHESLGEPRSFDDSFILAQEIFCIYMCHILVL